MAISKNCRNFVWLCIFQIGSLLFPNMSSANAPDAERVLTLYRLSSWAGGAARIEVELNGVKTELGAFSTLELKPKEGINEFKKTAMISTFGARVENAPNFFKPETFSFTYRKGELLKIGVAALEPTVLYRLDKDGNYLSDKKVVEIKTIHDVYAKPENVSVKVVYPEGKWEKNLYDNSKAVPKNEQVKVGISFFDVLDIEDFGAHISEFDFFKIPSVELTNLELIRTLLDFQKVVYIEHYLML